MRLLPSSASDTDLVEFVDGWAALLEREEYEAAYRYTDHAPRQAWTPALLREVVKAYADADPNQRVTLSGTPSDVVQRKEVTRWPTSPRGTIGEVWYDLNIDGVASDLTATFDIFEEPGGLKLVLNEIHVM